MVIRRKYFTTYLLAILGKVYSSFHRQGKHIFSNLLAILGKVYSSFHLQGKHIFSNLLAMFRKFMSRQQLFMLCLQGEDAEACGLSQGDEPRDLHGSQGRERARLGLGQPRW